MHYYDHTTKSYIKGMVYENSNCYGYALRSDTDLIVWLEEKSWKIGFDVKVLALWHYVIHAIDIFSS